jgi:hypothetical protein
VAPIELAHPVPPRPLIVPKQTARRRRARNSKKPPLFKGRLLRVSSATWRAPSQSSTSWPSTYQLRRADRHRSACRFDQRSDDGAVLGAAVGACEERIFPVEDDRTDGAFEGCCRARYGRHQGSASVPPSARAHSGSIRGRFCVKRCGPSRRRLRDASAVLENFARHPRITFLTLSALFRHGVRA